MLAPARAGCPGAPCGFCTRWAALLGWAGLLAVAELPRAGCDANAALAGLTRGRAPRGGGRRRPAW
ncbi:MAG: hypothetical protein MZW92_34915 [Comamonadaceae bacterium]|nr:hypothetical protein [Comamonadaceae bacterium]